MRWHAAARKVHAQSATGRAHDRPASVWCRQVRGDARRAPGLGGAQEVPGAAGRAARARAHRAHDLACKHAQRDGVHAPARLQRVLGLARQHPENISVLRQTLPGLAATSCRPFLILQAVQLLSISSETPGLLAHACHARCPLQPGLAHLSAVPQQPFALLGPAGTAAYITEPRWHGHASYGKVLHPTQQLPSQAKFTGPWPLRRRHRSHHCVIAVALASPARRGARRARCSPAAARQRAPPARRPCR